MQLNTKLYIAFFSLFFFILSNLSFGLNNAYQTYRENQRLQAESFEIAKTIFRLEDLTSDLDFLGQKHLLTKRRSEMNQMNSEIAKTYFELNQLIQEIANRMALNGSKIDSTRLLKKWERFWINYNKGVELSQENNDVESQILLLEANQEYEELNKLYIQPAIKEYYQSFSHLLEKQNENNLSYIWVRTILLFLSIAGFIVFFYYLQKALKESTHLKDRLEFLAFHDELTELPNRRKFEKEVMTAINNVNASGNFAIMYLDMDKFKFINDNFGHEIGDLVLKAFTKRVVGCIRESDVFGRQGGDEFTIFLKDINDEVVAEVANRIIKSFQKPICVGKQYFPISTSIGIAIYPTNGKDYITLIKNADDALYEAKKSRNTFVLSNGPA